MKKRTIFYFLLNVQQAAYASSCMADRAAENGDYYWSKTFDGMSKIGYTLTTANLLAENPLCILTGL